jgi:hypothetical protein
MTTFAYLVDKDVATTKEQLTNTIKAEIKKDYVKTSWNGNELSIKIEKMGTSEIKMSLQDNGKGTKIQETKRNIAMMHKPFIGDVERMVVEIFENKLGAKKA